MSRCLIMAIIHADQSLYSFSDSNDIALPVPVMLRLLIFDLLRLRRGVYGGNHICNVPLSESVNLCPSDP